MTKLAWDQAGEHRYETGIDRGVLYPLDDAATPWNGLVSVTEDSQREVKAYYQDGIKYLEQQVVGAYAAKLRAFTYPDILDILQGIWIWTSGVRVHEQRAQRFHLSYRTLIGNDLEGTDHGYKLHVVYNVLATPSDTALETVSETPAPAAFEWDLSGIPIATSDPAFRASCHVSIDSRYASPSSLAALEALLYGTDTEDPSIPALGDLLNMM